MVKAGDVVTYRAEVYRNYSSEGDGAPVDQILADATVTVDDVVHYRHFRTGAVRGPRLRYLLFGSGDEAHLAHVIEVEPDFQHLVSLAPPAGLAEVELRAGIEVEFDGTDGSVTPCSSPLLPGTHVVLYDGDPARPLELTIASDGERWFSTGNLLNRHDPCAG